MSLAISEETLQNFLTILPAVLYEYVLYEDHSGEFLYMSPTAKNILGYDAEYFVEDIRNFWGLVHPEDVIRLSEEDVSANQQNEFFVSEVRFSVSGNKERWIRLSSKPTDKKKKNSVIWSGYITDVTEVKNMETERDVLAGSLSDVQDELTTLKNIISICAYCKKIRDDDGTWERLEEYFMKHSDAEFSHGICPTCIEKERYK